MFKIFLYPIILLTAIYTLVLLPKCFKFKGSNYRTESGNSFISTITDKGKYGEFLTFLYLESIDEFKRILVNVYIPKDDGTTTEIDLIMLSPRGIYVIESKNFSGWIFGDEKSRYWTQTLENRQKNKLFNPIWQNKGHIKALRNSLNITDESIYRSYIVFSERCELKKIKVSSANTQVLKRNDLLEAVLEDMKDSPPIIKIEDILGYYEKLKKYTNVDEATKEKHVGNIRKSGY